MNIPFAPEVLFHLFGFPVTNALFTAVIVFFVIIIFLGIVSLNLKYARPSKFQLMLEGLIMGLLNMVEDVIGKERGRMVFGFTFIFFVFILFSNWFGIFSLAIPLGLEHKVASSEEVAIEKGAEQSHVVSEENGKVAVEEVKEHSNEQQLSIIDCLKTKHCYLTTNGIKVFHESKHIFRAPSSDLSGTIALAIISVLVTNIIGIWTLKLDYVKKFLYFLNIGYVVKMIFMVFKKSGIKGFGAALGIIFNFLIYVFVGLLEIVSEFGKILSFSFRLFGNIFAGEVLLLIITTLTLGALTLPFLGLEVFVGFIQAFVFFILTTAFIGLAVMPHDEH